MSAGPGTTAVRRSLWIPWAFVAFFGVVLAVNITMIAVGFATWPGLDTTDAYQRGLAYDRAIEAADAQAALGWQVDLEVSQEDESQADGSRAVGSQTDGSREKTRRAVIELTFRDRHGNMVRQALVRARLVRPTHEGHDLELELPHHQGGRYRAEIELPLPGQWEVRVVVEHRGQRHHSTRRLHLSP